MARTEVGAAYVSIYPDTSDFSSELASELGASKVTNAISGAGEKASKSFESGFSSIKVALGNLVSDIASDITHIFTDNLDRGIQRLDTIRNFPKLMTTFGYSADEASASIAAIQEHLDGLPGSTDEVLRLVQAISDSTGSLALATSTGLAFNDMLTASGADASTAMYATRMFDQMLGGAAYSAQRWQGIVSKMPLQMNMVAESLLGAGANSAQLGEALKDGEVSMQDLAQAMSDLGPQFTEQARAMSFGIGTAMTNVQNRMGMGVAAILDSIGQERIAGIINDFSYGVRDAMVAVGDAIGWLVDKIDNSGLGYLISNIGTNIENTLGKIDWEPLKNAAAALVDLVKGGLQWLVDNHPTLHSLFLAVSDVVGGALQWIVDNGNTITFVLGAIAGVAAVLIGYNLGAKLSALATMVSGFFTILMANPLMLIVGVIAAIVAGLVAWFTQTEDGREEWRKLTEAVGRALDSIKSAFKRFSDNAKKTWGNIKTTVTDAWEKIRAVVEPIVASIGEKVYKAWNNIKTTTKTVFNAVRGIVEPIWNSIKTIIKGVVDFITSFVKGDFEGMKTSIGTIFGGIRDYADSVWNAIKTAISTPIEAAKTAVTNVINAIKTFLNNTFGAIKTNTTNVWNGIKSAITAPIDAARGVVQGAIGGIQGIINGLTGKKVDVGINNKRGNIVNDVQSKINSLTGKTVNLNANENVTKACNNAQSSIKNLTGKTVWIEYRGYQSGLRGIEISTYTTAAGNKRVTQAVPLRAAAGGIATKATLGIWGEAGNEALVPLSNRSKVRPFARAVAAEIGGGGSVTVTGNTFIVRNDDDIPRIAQEISTYSNRQMAGRL